MTITFINMFKQCEWYLVPRKGDLDVMERLLIETENAPRLRIRCCLINVISHLSLYNWELLENPIFLFSNIQHEVPGGGCEVQFISYCPTG